MKILILMIYYFLNKQKITEITSEMKLFIELLINIFKYNYNESEQTTALLMAVEIENIEIVQLLLNCPSIDPNISLKKTVFSIAIEKGNYDLIHLRMNDKKVNPNIVFKDKKVAIKQFSQELLMKKT